MGQRSNTINGTEQHGSCLDKMINVTANYNSRCWHHYRVVLTKTECQWSAYNLHDPELYASYMNSIIHIPRPFFTR